MLCGADVLLCVSAAEDDESTTVTDVDEYRGVLRASSMYWLGSSEESSGNKLLDVRGTTEGREESDDDCVCFFCMFLRCGVESNESEDARAEAVEEAEENDVLRVVTEDPERRRRISFSSSSRSFFDPLCFRVSD